jgi:iron complex transport system permease protein
MNHLLLHRRFLLILFGSGLILFIIFIVYVGVGSTYFTPREVLAALRNQPIEEFHRQIIWDLRVPRALIAILAGAMLGLAGAIMQSITRNPLAEPGLTGVTAGSVMVAVLYITYAPGFLQGSYLLPLAAFIGGMGTTLLVYILSLKGKTNPLVLVLNGVILSAVLSSVTSLMLLLEEEKIGSILLWIIGSLNGKVWNHWEMIWPWAVIAIPLGLASSRFANILQLGDEAASGLGLKVEFTRLGLLVIAALLTASAVTVVGAIGFIGLIGPHITRHLVGEDASRVFPLSAVLTAGLLLCADILAQNFNLDMFVQVHKTGGGLPVGAVTVLLGAPFFLYLVRKKRS